MAVANDCQSEYLLVISQHEGTLKPLIIPTSINVEAMNTACNHLKLNYCTNLRFHVIQPRNTQYHGGGRTVRDASCLHAACGLTSG